MFWSFDPPRFPSSSPPHPLPHCLRAAHMPRTYYLTNQYTTLINHSHIRPATPGTMQYIMCSIPGPFHSCLKSKYLSLLLCNCILCTKSRISAPRFPLPKQSKVSKSGSNLRQEQFGYCRKLRLFLLCPYRYGNEN